MATKLIDPSVNGTTSSNIDVLSGEKVTLYLSANTPAGNGSAEILFEAASGSFVPVYTLGWFGERTATFEGPVKYRVSGTAGVYRA